MAQHVGFGSHLHLHQTPLFTKTTTSITESSSTTLSLPPCFPFTFPSSSISISRSSLIPLKHEEGEELLQDDDSVVVSSLQPICSEDHFNRVLAQSQHALLVVWMANWCRKCIYLKPKLEKLAVDYYPSVDVNAVSHKLVARAGVTIFPSLIIGSDREAYAYIWLPIHLTFRIRFHSKVSGFLFVYWVVLLEGQGIILKRSESFPGFIKHEW
ncbi:thioredoxin-like 3-2, chloroplastic isoform X2 [Medicago truncatula]|uniref:thioredoxin-like 3-2, chloroplastic isoform X2 n=1 Tax=Medicago truncatula TaxID=3880 RepID=UPI00196755F9|nr:thioredoxin-like 3-2, chloroplastic isoform X2 [Medicago truncatula]